MTDLVIRNILSHMYFERKNTIQSKEDNYVYYNQKWKKLLLKKLLIH